MKLEVHAHQWCPIRRKKRTQGHGHLQHPKQGRLEPKIDCREPNNSLPTQAIGTKITGLHCHWVRDAANLRMVRPHHSLPFHFPQGNGWLTPDDRDDCGRDAYDRDAHDRDAYDRDCDARVHDVHDRGRGGHDRDWTPNHLDADAVARQSDKNCGNWVFQTKQNLASNIAIPHLGVAKAFALDCVEL